MTSSSFQRLCGSSVCIALLTGMTLATTAFGASGQGEGQPAATAEQSASGSENLGHTVVTATAVPVAQLAAGTAIETAGLQQILDLNAFNVGDLLQMVSPGTWSEPTGGKSSGATEVAGYPSTHGAPFSTVMVNGTPLYGAAQLSYMDTSTLFRIDDTIARVEAALGGTAAILGPGQIGSTANFILRTGTAVPSGDIGLTYGFEGRERIDGFYGFPIGHNWYGSIGGFYRVSDGIRDPQYKADKGGQLTATLKHQAGRATFKLWARVLDDKNLFIKQVPIIQAPDGEFHAYPGFEPLTGTYYSRAIQYSQVPSPRGGLEDVNLADGRGANMRYLGLSYETRLGTWTLADHALYSHGRLPTAALFPGSNPQPLKSFVYGCNVPEPAGFCTADNEPVDKHTLEYPADRTIIATLPNGNAVPLGQSVIEQGMTFNHKQLASKINDFRASDEIFSGNTLTAGLYVARYRFHNNNSSGNQMLLLNQPHTKPIRLAYVENGKIVTRANAQGYVDLNGARVFLEHGRATNTAVYLSDTWAIGAWTLVAGARIENENAHDSSCNRSPVDLDGNPLTLYDNRTKICNGSWDDEHYNVTHPSFAASVNYRLNSHASVYANASTGGHFDNFNHGIKGAHGDFPPMLTVKDMEAGFRYRANAWSLDLNVYHRLFDGIQYQETDRNGVPIAGAMATYGSNAHGLNLIANWSPVEHFSVSLTGNYVDGHYTHNNACVPGFNINGVSECLSFDGEPLARQPEVHYRLTPEYTWPATWGSIGGWLTLTHVGQRYEDQTGMQPLGRYDTLAAGIVANVGPHWQVRLQGTNLTNAFGITEGNTRVLGKSVGRGGVILARPLFGREVFVKVKYRF